MKNYSLLLGGSRETQKKGFDGVIIISFLSKDDLTKKAEKIIGLRWRYAQFIENEEVIVEAQRVYDDFFDSVHDVVDFIYKK